jgi:hypothetical protein
LHQVTIEVAARANRPHQILALELAVERQLSLAVRVGDLVGAEIDWRRAFRVHPAQDRRAAKADPAALQIRETDRPGGPALGCHVGLQRAGLMRAELEIPVPDHGVHRQVKMRVNDEHGCRPSIWIDEQGIAGRTAPGAVSG